MSVAIRDIADIFARMGFDIAYGPELEDEWFNFDALNVPPDHPARDMQDTFWTKEETRRPPRTHTTSVTARELKRLAEEGSTESRMIIPGKVFRNEATDVTHEAQFYQLDGYAIGPTGTITLAHLKGVLQQFYKEYLGDSVNIRFRPSFFGFTEPSVEVDAWYEAPSKEGKWLEVCGGGMIHPRVLRDAGLDPDLVQGFAFGGGIERAIMIKHGIDDVRRFYSGDIRFIYGFDTTV